MQVTPAILNSDFKQTLWYPQLVSWRFSSAHGNFVRKVFVNTFVKSDHIADQLMIAEQEGDGKQVRSTTHDALLESGHGEGSLKDLNNLTKYVASLDFWEDANELQKHTEVI